MPPIKLRNWLCLTTALTLGTVAQTAAADAPPPTAAQPRAVNDMRSAIDQTAAVVEGRVSDIRYEFNQRDGPWTTVVLSEVRTHFGSAPEELQLRQLGGPLPDGTTLVVTHLPEFVEGEQYVVFLRNTAWNLSPVVNDLAWRVDGAGDAESLVTSDGHAVLGVAAQGVEVGGEPLLTLQAYGSPLEGVEDEEAQATSATTLPTAPSGDGTEAVTSATSTLSGSGPLDRAGFLAALDGLMASQGMSVSGEFYDEPAGEFRWYGQPTARPTGTPAATDGVSGGEPEIDTSRPGAR